MAHVTPIADSTRDDWDRVIERRDAASAESSGGGSSV
jgi:hypothetical protein